MNAFEQEGRLCEELGRHWSDSQSQHHAKTGDIAYIIPIAILSR